MKNVNLPKISFIVLILCGLFFNNAYAWTCGRPCPSSVFSGKLECEIAQSVCPREVNNESNVGVEEVSVLIRNQSSHNIAYIIDGDGEAKLLYSGQKVRHGSYQSVVRIYYKPNPNSPLVHYDITRNDRELIFTDSGNGYVLYRP